MTRSLEQGLAWAEQGTTLFGQQVGRLVDEEQWQAATALPGWTPKHLVAHVGANALALRNLVAWARTGTETPMYSSPEQRNADIESGSRRTGAELAQFSQQAGDQLAADLAAMDAPAWQANVVTAQGRTVPATEIPWMRAREVMVHAVDLAGSQDLADLPQDFVLALGEEIVAKRSGAGKDPALVLRVPQAGVEWRLEGDGEPVELTGTAGQVVAHLAGRPTTLTTGDGQPAPELSPWL